MIIQEIIVSSTGGFARCNYNSRPPHRTLESPSDLFGLPQMGSICDTGHRAGSHGGKATRRSGARMPPVFRIRFKLRTSGHETS
ncbi:hypothetical protein BD309DRAFT_949117, partial [Dichomitus squalens]